MQLLTAILATAALWFVAAGVLYMNPFAKGITDAVSQHPGVKRWDSQRDMLLQQLIFGVLAPTVVFAIAYLALLDWLPMSTLGRIGVFGLVLVGLRVVPRAADMAMLSSYPRRLVALDFVNGTLTCFVIAAPLAWLL